MSSHLSIPSYGVVLLMLSLFNTGSGKQEGGAALIIIDVQDCFLPGGSLTVNDGENIIPVINKIRRDYGNNFSVIALSKDWHLPGHISFATSHPGKNVGDTVDLYYKPDGDLCLGGTVTPNNFPSAVNCSAGSPTTITELPQRLWPVHCVQNVTTGPTSSKLSDNLTLSDDDVIILKGVRKVLDSYSAFFDNGDFGETELNEVLNSKDISTVFVTGLALDYCVFYTSKDAHRLGYDTYVVLDASRGVAPNTVDAAKKEMVAEGIHLIQSKDIGNILSTNSTLGDSSDLLRPASFPLVIVTSLVLSYCTRHLMT